MGFLIINWIDPIKSIRARLDCNVYIYTIHSRVFCTIIHFALSICH